MFTVGDDDDNGYSLLYTDQAPDAMGANIRCKIEGTIEETMNRCNLEDCSGFWRYGADHPHYPNRACTKLVEHGGPDFTVSWKMNPYFYKSSDTLTGTTESLLSTGLTVMRDKYINEKYQENKSL